MPAETFAATGPGSLFVRRIAGALLPITADRRTWSREGRLGVTSLWTSFRRVPRPSEYLVDLNERKSEFVGFNLLVGDETGAWWLSNRSEDDAGPVEVEPGVHGLSNHLLDSPWKKVTRGKQQLQALLGEAGDPPEDKLLRILADPGMATEDELPNTGITRELERALSAAFISLPDYGTRASTVLLIDRQGGGIITERRFDDEGAVTATERLTF